ncbi:hypothetical protein [Phyllobacterium sp. P5_D12]
MDRRALLTLGTGLAVSVLTGYTPAIMATDKRKGPAGLLLADMEPDGLTKTYRKYRLLIIGQRDDGKATAIAQSVVDVLARFLSASRSKLVRAADTRRIGVLIGTHQQDIGIMTKESAEALFLAKAPFTDIRNVPLRSIVSFGSHVLVCRTDFVARHSYLVAQTLVEHQDLLPTPADAPSGIVPVHPGSQAYFGPT